MTRLDKTPMAWTVDAARSFLLAKYERRSMLPISEHVYPIHGMMLKALALSFSRFLVFLMIWGIRSKTNTKVEQSVSLSVTRFHCLPHLGSSLAFALSSIREWMALVLPALL